MNRNIILSPQEERINAEINSKEANYKPKNRVESILDTFKGARPKIDVERGLYFTQSFKETEGEPLILRWSKALGSETLKLTYNNDEELSSRFIVNETASFRSSIQWVHDYEIVLKSGLSIKRY